MLKRFYPDLLIDKVQNIDLDWLMKNSIKGLILDIDNTLVPQNKEADQKAVSWITKVRSCGLKACIVSNASYKRVIMFNEELKLPAIHRASKPGTKSFLRAAELLELKPDEIAVIGDQVFTDIYGGNKAGMFTILVQPIDKREYVFIRAKRIVEKIVLAKHSREYAGRTKTFKKLK